LAVYNKPHLSLADQLALLKQRGLQVSDEAAAIERLHRNGYYRLSAYWYPFRKIVENQRTNDFLPDSKFEDAHALCGFDKDFKLLLLDAIESVEIAVRAEIAMHLGSRDIFAHTKPHLFRNRFTSPDKLGKIQYEIWQKKFNDAVHRSRDEFVTHHNRKYGDRSTLPIWIAIELWDFGLLSRFYSGMNTSDCIAVATRFAIPNWRLMESWLRSLNYVRNIIAHHGRLWNINLVDSPKLPTKNGTIGDFDTLVPLHNVNTRIYSICCILAYFSKVIDPQSAWPRSLIESIESFPQMPYACIQDMGFPPDWQSHSFWK
jgi:abortive infection bacteriophage resistance protein